MVRAGAWVAMITWICETRSMRRRSFSLTLRCEAAEPPSLEGSIRREGESADSSKPPNLVVMPWLDHGIHSVTAKRPHSSEHHEVPRLLNV